jgi:hypothetical protein
MGQLPWVPIYSPGGGHACVTVVPELMKHADRAVIKDEWIERAIMSPVHELTQADGGPNGGRSAHPCCWPEGP